MPVKDQGATGDRFHVIPRVLNFIFNGDEVLLIKGAPTKRLWANKYNGIGGHVEPGEDVLSAARRELLEEARLECPDLHLCGTIIVNTQTDTGIGIYVFTGRTTDRPILETREGITQWVKLADLDKVHLVEDLLVLLPKVAGMKSGDPPFSGLYFYDHQEKLQVIFRD